jgi:proline dehydrogenase
MLRALLIRLSKSDSARQIVTRWAFARRASSRFVAGEHLEDAIRAIQSLNAKQINATLDHLGEHTTDRAMALRATEDILSALEAIERSGVRSNVSIKLTQIGMALDKSLCAENLQRIVRRAKELGNFIRIDMEDSPYTALTLDLYRWVRQECGCGNVGVVIQAYLYRSERDVAELTAQGAHIRLCKGAYSEPAHIAFPRKRDVDANFDKLAAMLIDRSLAIGTMAVSEDGKIPPMVAIASHDEQRIAFAKAYAAQVGLSKRALEFQMLFGIRRDLQEQLASEGYPVRVYVPYGTEWYPYFTRRLAERPANLWFFLSNVVRR